MAHRAQPPALIKPSRRCASLLLLILTFSSPPPLRLASFTPERIFLLTGWNFVLWNLYLVFIVRRKWSRGCHGHFSFLRSLVASPKWYVEIIVSVEKLYKPGIPFPALSHYHHRFTVLGKFQSCEKQRKLFSSADESLALLLLGDTTNQAIIRFGWVNSPAR